MLSHYPAPVAVDFAQYLSREAAGRVRSQLKELKPYSEIPGMISFGVGVPHPSTWPLNGMTLSIPFAGKSVFVPGYESRTPDSLLPLETYEHPSKGEALVPDLSDELQYSSTYGTKHFNAWWKEHVRRTHAPRYDDWEVLCTAGNTDGMDAVMRTCFNRGDYMLVEEFAYPGLLSPAASLGLRCLGVSLDKHGMDPEALDNLMRGWDEAARGGPRPKLVVVVPTCSNPAGVTMPEERKRDLYSVCQRWNLLIVEDDPYCFLQIRPDGANSPIVPTFLSIDTDGRVIRIDSFSKIVAPGSRVGFITGHKFLVEKLMNSRESATQCPSGISIATITAILRAWGSHEGFERNYLPHISAIYGKRCLFLISLLRRYVPEDCIELPSPSGGMFLWVRLKIENHPDFPTKTPEDISNQVFHSLVKEKVLVAPSVYFKAPSTTTFNSEEEARNIFVRLSFSLPPPEQMEEGAKRMGRALAAEWVA
ncbi:hypothetical protein JCM24511_09985 [Saitozyma sp. JCM 24511]|nr:hypothetical protein JCM24511_09985 [Saitozyma sp. JCM 24511]